MIQCVNNSIIHCIIISFNIFFEYLMFLFDNSLYFCCMKKSSVKNRISRIFILLMVLLAANRSNVQAQVNSIAPTIIDSLQKTNDNWERFSVSFGGFLSNYNSGISIGSERLGIGIHIDLEDALGLKTAAFAFRGNTNYRFGKKMKHAVSFGYFGVYRNSHKVLQTELEIGNIVIPVGSEINSSFDLSIWRAKYDYSFLQNENVSLGVSVGLFIMPIKFSVKTLHFEEQATDLVAPLPVIGLRSDFLITEKLYLRQSVELLLISIDNFQGRILDLDIKVEHQTFEHISFGLGINSNRLNIKAKGDTYPNIDFFGEIGMEYSGIYFFAKYHF